MDCQGAELTSSVAIVCAADAPPLVVLAAREVCRYSYLRSGRLLPMAQRLPDRGDAIVVKVDPASGLGPEQYRLQTATNAGRTVLTITGGDPAGTLYGAYRFAEHLGVRFYLHGDVVPDRQTAFGVPKLDETGKPLFDRRGIQPFHDFPEGPDWWNVDDYRAILSQLPKLRMNFFGLHTYPEGGVGPEPLVWIGPTEEVGSRSAVKAAYPARHFTTANITGAWGYRPQKTGDYAFGAAQLFGRDDFGPDYMQGMNPWTEQSPEQSNELFGRMGTFLHAAFTHARRLGIKTCLGTETPLHIPSVLQERLKAEGKDPQDPTVVRAVYEGMFRRIGQTHPLDYYWFWTPERWTWSGASDEQVRATVQDLQLAIAAAKSVKAPFTLATCGWVLGPPQDRALFDRMLPKEMPLSCINRNVGFSEVELGFARIQDRPQWAIPWMEDDPALIIPQLWAGRMRRDAADAHAYGCTGLMGIHWRTRILGPNVAALAHAAWEQRPWNPDFGKRLQLPEPKPVEGRVGGNVATFPTHAIAETEEDPVYQTVRWAIGAYRLKVPVGTYKVTLKFCEPHYREKGKRVFGVKLQGKPVIDRLDILAKVGPDKAVDYTFDATKVEAGWLVIDFVRAVEHPLIAGIVIDGRTADANQIAGKPYTRKINCAGPKWQDYEADLPDVDPAADQPARPRDLPVDDFYADWAESQFGPEVAQELARLFVSLDGSPPEPRDGRHTARLPRPSTWVKGPGGIVPDSRPWDQVRAEYRFVDEMAALRPRIQGGGNRERFDYWLDQFRYLRAVGHFSCTWGRFTTVLKQIKAEEDVSKQRQLVRRDALPIRRELIEQLAKVHRHLLASVTTWGGLGNVTNWQQHVIPQVLDDPAGELAKILGEPLPDEAPLPKEHVGPARVSVPTVRTAIDAGERLKVHVLLMSNSPPTEATLWWKPMGKGELQKLDLRHRARGSYSAELPSVTDWALEYHIKIRTANGQRLVWPATAPAINQTVVVMPKIDK